MQEKKVICIICPEGCNITVRGEGYNIEFMKGHACKRGEEYARNEFSLRQSALERIAEYG